MSINVITFSSSEVNPLDYIYQALRINLQLMDERDPMLKIIMRYIYNTSKVSSVSAKNTEYKWITFC